MPTDTRELEKELLAGLEGVSPGPWEYYKHYGWQECVRAPDGEVGSFELDDDAKHIARCSPDNIRALLATIADLRATVAEARKETVARCLEVISPYPDAYHELYRRSAAAAFMPATEPSPQTWGVTRHIRDADPEWLKAANFATKLSGR